MDPLFDIADRHQYVGDMAVKNLVPLVKIPGMSRVVFVGMFIYFGQFVYGPFPIQPSKVMDIINARTHIYIYNYI